MKKQKTSILHFMNLVGGFDHVELRWKYIWPFVVCVPFLIEAAEKLAAETIRQV